jgi:hypothetical protein
MRYLVAFLFAAAACGSSSEDPGHESLPDALVGADAMPGPDGSPPAPVPTVLEVSPLGGTTAATTQIITVRFSQPMRQTDVVIASVPALQHVCNEWDTQSSQVTCRLPPQTQMAASTLHTVRVLAASPSQAGVPLGVDHTWSFTTGGSADFTAPSVTLAHPADDTGGYPLEQPICLTFSEPMDQARTGAALTVTTAGVIHAGSVSWQPGNKMCFFEAGTYQYNDEVTYTVSALAADLSGNTLPPTSGTFRVHRRATSVFTPDAARTGTVTSGGIVIASEGLVGYGGAVYGRMHPRITFAPALPAGAYLEQATLRLNQVSTENAPYEGGHGVYVFRCDFGDTLASALSVECLSPTILVTVGETLGWVERDWAVATRAALQQGLPVQVGLKLTRSDVPEEPYFASFPVTGGNAAQLVVTYTYPGD